MSRVRYLVCACKAGNVGQKKSAKCIFFGVLPHVTLQERNAWGFPCNAKVGSERSGFCYPSYSVLIGRKSPGDPLSGTIGKHRAIPGHERGASSKRLGNAEKTLTIPEPVRNVVDSTSHPLPSPYVPRVNCWLGQSRTFSRDPIQCVIN